MGKHSGAPDKDDQDKFHTDVRSLPTYRPEPPTPYDEYTRKVPPPGEKPKD